MKQQVTQTKAKLRGGGSRPLARFAEIVIVLAAILLVVAIAAPAFQARRDNAQVAEVKQNLHAIQLALERYSTDIVGSYPYFLFGGELDLNIGTINGVNTQYTWRPYPNGKIIQPFDLFWQTSQSLRYDDVAWQDLAEGRASPGFGDVLQTKGYMPRYPRNPFQLGPAGKDYGLEALGTSFQDHACFGGSDGRRMWNNAWFGEAPQLMFFSALETEPVDIEYPGSFAYLPRWSDVATNSGHLHYQIASSQSATKYRSEMESPLGMADAQNVTTLDVAGYDLVAFGSNQSKGQDMDDSILDANGAHYWRTGYLGFGQARNPWVTKGLWGGKISVEDFDGRPFSDGIDDFIILHVGSGYDKNIHDNNGSEATP
jgi:type II secretory pathway pseudopilin PulG